MKKQSLLFRLLAIVLFFASFSIVNAQFAGGTGTDTDPYQISTVTELQAIRDIATATSFVLTSDIDFTSEANQAAFDNSGAKFLHKLNGAGFVIKNLTIDGQGFATELGGASIITNLGFDNVSVNSTASFGTGVIAGFAWGCTITKCYVINSTVISATDDSNGQAVGAIIGAAMGSGILIEDCYTDNVSVTGRIGVGALVGRLNGTMNRCAAYGGTLNVSEKNDDQGDGKGAGYVGPIVGDSWKESTLSLSNNYYSTTGFTYNLAGAATSEFLEKLNDGTTDIAVGISDLAVQADFVGFDFDNVWTMGTTYPILGEPAAPFISTLKIESFTWEDATRADKQLGQNSEVTLVIKYDSVDAQDALYLLVANKDDWSTNWVAQELTLPLDQEEITVSFDMRAYNDTLADANRGRVFLAKTATASWGARIDVAADADANNDAVYYDIVEVVEASYEELTSVVTEKHNGTATVTGGYYMPGDSIELSLSYRLTTDAKLSLAFKAQEGGYITTVLAKQELVLPTTSADSVYTYKVAVPDTLTFEGTCRIAAWLGAWSSDKEIYEYIAIGEEPAALREYNTLDLTVYPNPSEGLFNFTLQNPSQIVVRDLAGKTIVSKMGIVGLNTVEVLISGVYILSVESANEVGNSIIQVK